jgi:hypothetical protein
MLFGALGEFALGDFIEAEEAVVVDYLIPDGDVIDGGWTNELGGTVLFTSIDEAVIDDADYIRSSTNPVADLCKVSISDPFTVATEPMSVNYRYKKSGFPVLNLRVRLLQGATEIAAWTHNDISSSFVTETQPLSSGQFSSITNFNDLYLEFTANP